MEKNEKKKREKAEPGERKRKSGEIKRERERKNVGKERRSFLTGSLKIKKKERRGSVDPT